MDNIIKNKYGYFSVENPPSQTELEEYYVKKYYQEAKGGYEIEYDEAELKYFNNKIAEKAFILEENLDKTFPKSFLDIGCGEGWALKFFKKKGWEVLGLDYSSNGCQKFNPECMENLLAGNIYENINKLIEQGKKFDVLWADNVLEHVIDPGSLVNDFKKIITLSGILVAEVPNDFSIIQNYILDKGYVDKKYWIDIPEHLSYFDKNGFENLLYSNGWQTIICLADYPIDWNLLNPDTNYIQNKTKGKSCYRERIEFENLVHTLPMDEVINFYKAMCDLGLGRSISGFFKLKE